jgi:hypothetical protein
MNNAKHWLLQISSAQHQHQLHYIASATASAGCLNACWHAVLLWVLAAGHIKVNTPDSQQALHVSSY